MKVIYCQRSFLIAFFYLFCSYISVDASDNSGQYFGAISYEISYESKSKLPWNKGKIKTRPNYYLMAEHVIANIEGTTEQLAGVLSKGNLKETELFLLEEYATNLCCKPNFAEFLKRRRIKQIRSSENSPINIFGLRSAPVSPSVEEE